MAKELLLLITICTLSSCYIKGLTNGYKRLNLQDQKKVVFEIKDCVDEYSDTIYAYTGKEMQRCLIEDDTAVLYRWDPNCSSKSCIPLIGAQYYCDSKKWTLYVMLEYFDLPKQQSFAPPSKSIIISDFKQYKSNFADAANNAFIEDLTLLNKKDDLIKYKRYFFFKNGKFLFAKDNLY